MSFTSNYLGRVSDIDMFGRSTDTGVQEVTLSFGDGNVVAGPYKEAQKFMRILLSDNNTLLGQPDYGADLFKNLNTGAILNEAQFRIYFIQAKAATLAFMRKAKAVNGERSPRFKDDEALKDVIIQSIIVTPGTFKLVLKFEFVDANKDIIIPVGIPVGT